MIFWFDLHISMRIRHGGILIYLFMYTKYVVSELTVVFFSIYISGIYYYFTSFSEKKCFCDFLILIPVFVIYLFYAMHSYTNTLIH